MGRSKAKFIVLALVVLALAWGIFSHRLRIETWLWHMRHGNAVNVGNFVIPVPANWYVQDEGNGGKLLVRIDTSDQTPYKRLKAHAGMLLLPERPLSDLELGRMTSLDTASMKRNGADTVLQRTFSPDGGSISCVGGEKLGSMGIYDIEPTSWSCKSPAGLWVMVTATDPDMAQVWEIVSGIRKKS